MNLPPLKLAQTVANRVVLSRRMAPQAVCSQRLQRKDQRTEAMPSLLLASNGALRRRPTFRQFQRLVRVPQPCSLVGRSCYIHSTAPQHLSGVSLFTITTVGKRAVEARRSSQRRTLIRLGPVGHCFLSSQNVPGGSRGHCRRPLAGPAPIVTPTPQSPERSQQRNARACGLCPDGGSMVSAHETLPSSSGTSARMPPAWSCATRPLRGERLGPWS